MSNHWLKAQEEQRAKHGTNIVIAQDSKGRDVVLVGNPMMGWRLVTPEGIVGANTAHGVEGVLEELHMPFLGWQ